MSSFPLRTARGALVLAAAAVAACQDPVGTDRPRPSTGAASAATAEATIEWNQVARDLVMKHSTSAPASIRTFALLSVAQYNAIVAAERAPARTSDRGAVAGASVAVLSYVYPQEAQFLAALATAARAAAPAPTRKHDDFAAGEEVGRSVA